MRQTNKKIAKTNVKKIVKNLKMIVFDFDGVFTDNRVLVSQDGKEFVFCWRSDGLGIGSVESLGIKTLVISSESNPVISARCKKLDIRYIKTSEPQNKTNILRKYKVATLKKYANKLRIPLKNIAYLGNDVNDLGCLKIVGLPAGVADSHPDILMSCLYITKARGGYGAVREFCDFIVQVKSNK